MLVFSTRMPLKANITRENCLQLFIDWIEASPHYSAKIPYDIHSQEDFSFENEVASFSIANYADAEISLAACRLETTDKNATWGTVCVFRESQNQKDVLIQLDCKSDVATANLPRPHKPYIVRKFVEADYCADDGEIPISDSPILIHSKNLDLCARVMRGETTNMMPVVYLSCDYGDELQIDAVYLAQQLGGIAHVFQESSREIGWDLKELTSGKNAHSGFIGVYFPGNSYCKRFNVGNYPDKTVGAWEIINSVRQSVINSTDVSTDNWTHIKLLQSMQKLRQSMQKLRRQHEADNDSKAFEEMLLLLEDERNNLQGQIDTLREQNDSLQRQLDKFNRNTQNIDAFFNMGIEQDLYPGEHSDLLRNLLEKSLNHYQPNTRPYHIIQALLDANPEIGTCRRIMEELKAIFKNGANLNAANKARLKKLGFTLKEDGGTHYKLIFHDARYQFSMARSPSDRREGQNLCSDIRKNINVIQ